MTRRPVTYEQAYRERWPTPEAVEREVDGWKAGPRRKRAEALVAAPPPEAEQCARCNHPDGCRRGCEWGRK